MEDDVFSIIGYLSYSMILIISKLTLVNILVVHELFTLEPAVILPLAFESATVRPLHNALTISFVEFPFALKLSLLMVHNILIVLIEFHNSFSAPLAILKAAYIMVTSNIFDFTISIESALDEGAMEFIVIRMLLRLKNITQRVLKFTIDDLIIIKFSGKMGVVVMKVDELSFAVSYIILPFTNILDLRMFIKIGTLSMFQTTSMEAYIDIFVGVKSLHVAVLNQTIFKLRKKC